MKIVKEHLDEAVKHLSGRSVEDAIAEYFRENEKHLDTYMYDILDGLTEMVNFAQNKELISSEIYKSFEKSFEKAFNEYSSDERLSGG